MKNKVLRKTVCQIGLLGLIILGFTATVFAQEENEPRVQFSTSQALTLTENPAGGWNLEKKNDSDEAAEFTMTFNIGNVFSGTVLLSSGSLEIRMEETDNAITLHLKTTQTPFTGSYSTYRGRVIQVAMGANSEAQIVFKINGNLLLKNLNGIVDFNGKALTEGVSIELQHYVPQPPPPVESKTEGTGGRASDPNP